MRSAKPRGLPSNGGPYVRFDIWENTVPVQSSYRRRSQFVNLAALGCILLPSASALAQSSPDQRLSPDLLQTLGVGSRSIGMGNAYTAIADDASASFWNVGRLGFIRHDEAMVEYRSVVNSTLNSTGSSAPVTTGIEPGKPQLGFSGFVTPVTWRNGWLGSLGISYTMGGYFDATKDDSSTTTTVGFPNIQTISKSVSQILVRDSYLTFAYGQQFELKNRAPQKTKKTDKGKAATADDSGNAAQKEPSRLGIGLGVFFVNQDYTTQLSNSTYQQPVGGGPLTPTASPTSNLVSERGNGVGVTFGLAYDPASSPYSFGLSYHSRTQLSGLATGNSFGNQTPDHLSIGVAYKPHLQLGRKPSATKKGSDQNKADADKSNLTSEPLVRGAEPVVPLTLSAEYQLFSAANLSSNSLGVLYQEDRRRAVSNFHLGAEYRLHYRTEFGKTASDRAFNPHYEYAVRLGFHTDANAATLYTYYDNVVSCGLAIQRYHGPKLTYTLEPAVEMMTNSGLVQYTVSGRLSW
jgi:hypothetical protein